MPITESRPLSQIPASAPNTANDRIVGVKSGTNVDALYTIGQVLGFFSSSQLDVFGSAQGDILYRGAGGWTALTPGSTGQFLTTNGPSANPAWVSVTPGSGAPSGSTNSVQYNAGGGSFGGSPSLFAQGGGLLVNATNPTVSGDLTDAQAVKIAANFNSLLVQPGFSDVDALEVQLNYNFGQNQFGPDPNGGATHVKTTPIGLNLHCEHVGAGEHTALFIQNNCYGMSDSFALTILMTYANGPIAGDEGQAFSATSQCTQQSNLVFANITSVSRATLSTTTTANILASLSPQDVHVASTTGANPGDWVVFNRGSGSAAPDICAAQIISVNSGASTINLICPNNFSSPVTVTPALVLGLDSTFQFGQDRVLVNLQGASYSTGTVGQTAGGDIFGGGGGGNLTGSGTVWVNNMVGGDAANVGAISIDADTFANAPFTDGAGPPIGNHSSLRSWYQIDVVSNNTSLAIRSMSVANDQAYHGKCPVLPSHGTYIIRPAARILIISGATFICETSTHTWSVGNQVECAICPYPDTHGWQWEVGQFTPGGTTRWHTALFNNGPRTFQTGLQLGGTPGESAFFDPGGFSYQTGVGIDNCQIGVGIAVDNTNSTCALQIINAATMNDAGASIQWAGSPTTWFIQPDTPNVALNVYGMKLLAPSGSFHNMLIDRNKITADRTYAFPNASGDFMIAAVNTTGGGSAALGTNCPAVTPTAPSTWIRIKNLAGNDVYIPAWT